MWNISKITGTQTEKAILMKMLHDEKYATVPIIISVTIGIIIHTYFFLLAERAICRQGEIITSANKTMMIAD